MERPSFYQDILLRIPLSSLRPHAREPALLAIALATTFKFMLIRTGIALPLPLLQLFQIAGPT